MSFWISFPFWMMLVLLVVNAWIVSRISEGIKDDESDSPASNH